MRIAIVSQGFGYGGSYIAAANVGKALAAAGHDLYYFAYQYPTNYSGVPADRLIQFRQPHTRLQATFDKLGKGAELALRHHFTPGRYVRSEFKRLLTLIDNNKIDLVILNSFWSVTLFAQALREARPKLTTIGWMHEATDYSFGSLTKNYRPSFIGGIGAVSAIVCLTHTDQRKLSEYNNNVHVIYNPVVLSAHGHADLTAHRIIFTTRLDVQIKGLDYLVEVAKKLPEGWQIQVAGQGKPAQEQEFRHLIKDIDPSRLNFVGALQGEALAQHYQSGSMFLSTSRTEGLPLVIIEAMSFGLPVISFAHNGGREILSSNDAGILVPIGDVSGMIKAIIRLANDQQLREDYSRRSLSRYEAFKMPRVITKWQTLLASLQA